jgi:periplasmic copper chaperone A
MRKVALIALTLAALALAGCTTAPPVQNGGSTVGVGISVAAAWARSADEGNGAVYMLIRNIGNEPDRLVGVVGDVAGALELHTSENSNGVVAMRPVDGIDLPAGGQLELRPGGYHVMLVGLSQALAPGDRFPLLLQFERAGEVEVVAEVRNQ